MKKVDFFNGIKELLAIENASVNEESVLRDLENYSSLATLAIIAFIDENFGITVSAKQLNNVVTIFELMKLIGLEKFDK